MIRLILKRAKKSEEELRESPFAPSLFLQRGDSMGVNGCGSAKDEKGKELGTDRRANSRKLRVESKGRAGSGTRPEWGLIFINHDSTEVIAVSIPYLITSSKFRKY